MKKSVEKIEYRELWNMMNVEKQHYEERLEHIEFYMDWIDKRLGIKKKEEQNNG